MTSTPNDLTSRLRCRRDTERRQIEEMAVSEQRRLGESSTAAANDALRTIEADTAAWTGRIRGMLLRAWLWPVVVSLSLLLTICGGGWGALRWLWTSIEQQLETQAVLNVEIEQARQTLAGIEEATWGVTLREIEGERFVVLPAGALDHPSWTVGGRPALKLSSE